MRTATTKDAAGRFVSDEFAACQHCGHEVAWTRRPADAGYAALVHIATNTIECPK